jgi:Tfp pilus assembly protein PilP
MKRLCYSGLLVMAMLLVVGCGRTDSAASVADQNELSRWVEQNPAPKEVELAPIQ